QRGRRLVIGREVPLGDPLVWEHHLLWMSDYWRSRVTSRALLSKRTPRSRGWRSFSFPVHSINPPCTTISGRTQCARNRGSPTAFVNGGFGVLSWSSRDRRSSS